MYHPTDRVSHTTAFIIPVVHWLEQEMMDCLTIEYSEKDPKNINVFECTLIN